MTCNGCGNPLCNAGPIMRAWRKTVVHRWLFACLLPAFLIGAFMPLAWGLGALCILTGAGTSIAFHAGRAFFRRAFRENPAYARQLPPDVYRMLTGELPPGERAMIDNLIANMRGALASGTLNPDEEAEVREGLDRLLAERDGADPAPPGARGRL